MYMYIVESWFYHWKVILPEIVSIYSWFLQDLAIWRKGQDFQYFVKGRVKSAATQWVN